MQSKFKLRIRFARRLATCKAQLSPKVDSEQLEVSVVICPIEHKIESSN